MKRKPSSFFVPPRGRTFNEVMWSNENVFTDDSSQKVEDDSTSPDTSTRNVDTTDSNSGTEESESDNSKGTSKRMWHIPFVLLLFMSAILAGVLVVFWHGQQQHEGYTPKSLDLLTHDHHINLKAGLEGGSAGYGGPRDQRIDEDSYAPETADEVTATTTEVTEEDVEDLTAPEQTIRKSTRTKIHTPLATTDVVLSVSKRSKKAKKHTTTTAGAPTTTDNAVPVPVRPIIRRPLLCTIGRYARASTKYPEDGLCDFLFCPVALQENLQFNSESDAFQGFRAQAAKSRKTQFGLDINVREMNATLARLGTDQGTSAFKSLWDGNVRQHGVFYPALRHNTDPAYVNMIIRLLKALRRLQLKFRTTDEVLPSHIFVGIALLLRGQDRDAGVKKHFNKIISVVKPDVILLRTHYLKKDDGNLLKCRITGPTVWQGSFSADQPTFPFVGTAGMPTTPHSTWAKSARLTFTVTLCTDPNCA
ncbi:uncharacterized protein LOC135393900 isoform X2 [Ornithodoros turicata]|uniref:uncharacterized protein LOC135393900 isoform X2 n=1 Tax=Ornithodoros turicata TaxID=34597 RepID=UPI003139DAE1